MSLANSYVYTYARIVLVKLLMRVSEERPTLIQNLLLSAPLRLLLGCGLYPEFVNVNALSIRVGSRLLLGIMQ